MFLSATPQDEFRAAEITSENAPSSSTTAVAATTASKMPRLLITGVGLFLVYMLMLKGKR
jgi:hypothetical protein